MIYDDSTVLSHQNKTLQKIHILKMYRYLWYLTPRNCSKKNIKKNAGTLLKIKKSSNEKVVQTKIHAYTHKRDTMASEKYLVPS